MTELKQVKQLAQDLEAMQQQVQKARYQLDFRQSWYQLICGLDRNQREPEYENYLARAHALVNTLESTEFESLA